MPGVPSSRGCDVCRTRKKKCDAGDKGPPCSRCRRLNVVCQGAGQQRYKFQDESKKFVSAKKLASSGNGGVTSRQKPSVAQITRNPSNQITRLTSAFVGSINPTMDIKYQLLWNFGDYLADVPRRLGVNPALDVASDALVSVHTSFCSQGHYVHDPRVLAKYSKALVALRDALNDPDKAYSSETLCAIMLLMIVQVLTNPCQGFAASHPEGAAQVLKGRGFSGPRDDFERNLLKTLRGPVIFEALVNDRIQFSQHEWKLLVESGLDNSNTDVEWLRYLACVPDLRQRCKKTLRCSSQTRKANLPNLIFETGSLLEKCRINITVIRERMATLEVNPLPTEFATLLYVTRLRLLGLALMTGIFLSCIHRSLLGEPLRLSSESSQWSNEIFHLSEIAVQFQPLGAMAMLLCLNAAWIGTPSEEMREAIKSLIVDYENAILGRPSVPNMTAALESTERRFTLVEEP